MATVVETSTVDVASILGDVIELTKELFPGVVMVDVVRDPEYPETRLTVIEAQTSEPAKEVVDRQLEWHRRVALLGKSCDHLCLSFRFEE